MTSVREFIGSELPRVEAYLSGQTGRLHATVQPIVEHVLLAGGKRLRPMLVLLTARACGLPPDVDPYPLACSLEILHSATLLHDDILDGAGLRRGRKSAHLLFGRGETILAGDVLLALANRIVAEYGEPRLTAILSEAILATATGEVMEIAAARDPDLPPASYLEIITGKTAFLFQAACRSGAVLARAGSKAEDAAGEFGLNLGIAFQLVDDALDYTAPEAVSGKPSGGDLREGKTTMPLLLFLESLPADERAQLGARFRANSLSEIETAAIIARVQDMGLPGRTRDAARDYADRAARGLAALPPSPERTHLETALDFVLAREK
jgi:octaprenyl-diphosphate synthase